MENVELIKEIFELCIVPLLGILIKYLVTLIDKKSKEIQEKTNNELVNKYIQILTETVDTCVIATNQTYVDSLKNKDIFDVEAQKQAFEKTYNAVMNILTDDAKEVLQIAYGDLGEMVKQLIECQVKLVKL